MGKIEHISVSMPVELASALADAVAAGEFASVEEAIVGFVEDWREMRDNFGLSDEEIGKLWDVGLASGRGDFQTPDEILAEAKRRSAARRRAAT